MTGIGSPFLAILLFLTAVCQGDPQVGDAASLMSNPEIYRSPTPLSSPASLPEETKPDFANPNQHVATGSAPAVSSIPLAKDAEQGVAQNVQGVPSERSEKTEQFGLKRQRAATLDYAKEQSQQQDGGFPREEPKKGSEDEVAGWFSTVGFMPAFMAAISMIVVSELGDKTFFIAAIMAMNHSRRVIFLAAMAALGLMTVLSVAVGHLLPAILPRLYTHYASVVLFFVFGVKLLKEASEVAGAGASEELEEVEHELNTKTEVQMTEVIDNHVDHMADVESGRSHTGSISPVSSMFDLNSLISPIFIQCFTMNFLAEWGDRSQIATIALATTQNPVGVTLGGIIGHSLCTGLAVIGGKFLAKRISEQKVLVAGGILFLLFALHGIWVGP